ncbi:hypothetical protein C8R47DRAFT_1135416 [Mycena vitilis]|nr:hypothetical protein C8R47DRAFT_1135416 [Mycena vitilis]
MSTGRLPVQELIDTVVDYLHDSPQALASCARASKVFVYRAQAHLFASVNLVDGGEDGEEYGSELGELRKTERLADTLLTSIHLAEHIRTLHVNAANLEPLAEIHFMNLHTISFVHRDNRSGSLVAPSNLEIVVRLVASPSVRRITFRRSWLSPDMWRVLVSATSNLTHIAFDFCRRSDSIRVPAAGIPRPPQSARPRISALTLENGPLPATLFKDHGCPVDFSALTHVATNNCGDQAAELLAIAPNTITHVDMCHDFQFEVLNVNRLSKLTHLTFDLNGIERLLPTLKAPNTIDTLVFVFECAGLWFGLSSPKFPAALLQRAILKTEAQLPALQRVEVEIRVMGAQEKVVSKIVAAAGGMPLLRAKFAVVIRCV